MLAAVRPVIAAVDVPVSVDLESGYGQKPADLVAGLIEAGGAGLNIEDTVHSEGGRLRGTQEHASYVAGLRAAADDAGSRSGSTGAPTSSCTRRSPPTSSAT